MENAKMTNKKRNGAFLHDALMVEKANRASNKKGLHRPKNTPYKRSSFRVNARNWEDYMEDDEY